MTGAVREGDRPTCATCGKSFGDANALYSHTRAKHGRKAAAAVRPPREDDEPSLGEELVAAIQAAHAGERVPEHLFVMFREQFPRGTKVMPLAEYTLEVYGPPRPPAGPSASMIAKRERYHVRRERRLADQRHVGDPAFLASSPSGDRHD